MSEAEDRNPGEERASQEEEHPPRKSTSPGQALIPKLIHGYGPSATEDSKSDANRAIAEHLANVAKEFPIAATYNILILYDPSVMVKGDADYIYSAVTSFEEKKPLLMILYSKGGDIGSAYLIGQLCREYSNGSFGISVPRHAKSAATLLCCAADQIHLGSLSELGPIDPQINGLPALGLKNSIQHIARLVKETPESAEMFAKYLHYSLKPIDLGYYERVAESAIQYAERLLSTHSDKLPRDSSAIADELVYTYKDHGFVIDSGEATKIFGPKIIRCNTEEYGLGNRLYKEIGMISSVAEYLDYRFYLIGSLKTAPVFMKV